MVKQRDVHGHLEGVHLRAVFGKKRDLIALMGKSTTYVERSHLTARLFNSRLVRNTGFLKRPDHASRGSDLAGRLL
jgi:hypothetical protein